MRIAIVGCGAMGSVYGAMFSAAGHDVVGISPDRAHVDAINANGLRVTGPGGDLVAPVKAMATPAGPAADLLIFATKSADTKSAALAAGPLVGPDTSILTIQNGLGAAERVASVFGRDRLAVGIAAAFGASITEPGRAHHNSLGAIHLGAYDGLDPPVLDRIANIWTKTGFTATAVDDVIAMQWEKLICNVAYSGPCALSDLSVGEVMDSPVMGPVSRNAAIEAHEIALALDLGIQITDPVAHVRAFGEKVYSARPSVLLDLDAGRKSEIEFINGAIGPQARKLYRRAPVNETITALVLDRERRLGIG